VAEALGVVGAGGARGINTGHRQPHLARSSRPRRLRSRLRGSADGLLRSRAEREEVTARLVVALTVLTQVRAAGASRRKLRTTIRIAIIANIRADHAQDGTAYERFTPSGPLALLPLYDGSFGVVWTARPIMRSRFCVVR